MTPFRSTGRWIAHVLLQPERRKRKFLRRYCADIRGRRILEIGSGRPTGEKFNYSTAEFFENNGNTVTRSDIDPDFGHTIVDITRSVPDGFDVISCFNVLEHVYDFSSAIDNMHEALPVRGQLLLYVPVLYPLHDEPHDYFRYTEHSLRRMFEGFSAVELVHFGMRELPFGYFVRATK